MKNLIKLFFTLLVSLATPGLFASSNEDAHKIEKDRQVQYGKNGKNGHYGEDGENGENGQNGGNGGNGGNAIDSSVNVSEQTNQNVDEMEYSALKEICRQILFTTISKFYDPLDEACLSSYKKVISTYLIQIGSSAARKIWQEYESVNWSYPASLSI